jgi:hypothetical protein
MYTPNTKSNPNPLVGFGGKTSGLRRFEVLGIRSGIRHGGRPAVLAMIHDGQLQT